MVEQGMWQWYKHPSSCTATRVRRVPASGRYNGKRPAGWEVHEVMVTSLPWLPERPGEVVSRNYYTAAEWEQHLAEWRAEAVAEELTLEEWEGPEGQYAP